MRPELPDAVRRLRDDPGAVRLELKVAGAADARRARDLVAQADDYLLPRLLRMDAPVLMVVGGSTGAGKSSSCLEHGPIADVLYSASGNSADEHWYNHGVLAYSFETGADGYVNTTLTAASEAGATAIRAGNRTCFAPGDTIRVDRHGRRGGSSARGCITAAALIGPPDSAAQLDVCARLDAGEDAANCVRRTKVQNLLDASTATYVKLIGRCRRFAGGARAACYRWLGKALAVLTDGAFEREGCPRLPSASARLGCEAGAWTMQEALVTFS